MSVEDIKGIWVASDDPAALDEVRAVAPAIFPNVDNSTIFWAAGGVPDGPAVATVKTRTDKQVLRKREYLSFSVISCIPDCFVFAHYSLKK